MRFFKLAILALVLFASNAIAGFRFDYEPVEFNIGSVRFAYGVFSDDAGINIVVARRLADGTYETWGGDQNTTGWLIEYPESLVLPLGSGKTVLDELIEQHGSLRNVIAFYADEAVKRARLRVAPPSVDPNNRISRLIYHSVVSVHFDPVTGKLVVPPAPLTP